MPLPFSPQLPEIRAVPSSSNSCAAYPIRLIYARFSIRRIRPMWLRKPILDALDLSSKDLPSKHSGQKGRARGQVLDEDRLMLGVSAFAHRTHAVQGRDSEGRGEIAV